ncbi:MAG: radical SAM protein [Bacteroidetes bacterium]|nr:radical SAM protein [Bacteroidota bacterium]|tara:strand:+ start:1229 stop:2119 length:891 start_codon:yes stop_codon:yes gene_type:complete
MISKPFQYSEPLFRPPSEARSLILQITNGCSWNRCSFCEMYTSKKFQIKKEKEIFDEIDLLAPYSSQIRKVFLADGNAMVLSFDKLMNIIEKLNSTFPNLNRISIYALPKDISTKTEDELRVLSAAGLKLIYTGIETGDDELLKLINKGETSVSTIEALVKARKSGLKLSVMILNGLGGKHYSKQHAINSAQVVNKIQPEYLSTLVLSFPYGLDHFKKRFSADFIELNKYDLISEMSDFISELNLQNTVFRSDHASNYLILKGMLNRDKEKLLSGISDVIDNPESSDLRPEWMRGL